MLLNSIKTKKEYIEKSSLTSGNTYKVTITYNKKSCTMKFHDNYRNESDKLDFVMCLLMDSECFESASSYEGFCQDFGYEPYEEKYYYPYYGKNKKSYAIYKACERQYKKLHRLFNDEEIEELQEMLQDY